MSPEDFIAVAEYARGLWKDFDLTKEQASMWQHKLKHYATQDVRSALAELYSRKSRFAPELDAVLDLLRKWKQAASVVDKQHDAAAVRNEQNHYTQEYNADLGTLRATFAPEQLEDCKAEILAREPHTAEWKKLPVESPWWVALITQRYIRGVCQVRRNGAWVDYPVDSIWQVERGVAA